MINWLRVGKDKRVGKSVKYGKDMLGGMIIYYILW